MSLQEYDPCESADDFVVGESYIFLRNASHLYDKNKKESYIEKSGSSKTGVKVVDKTGVTEVQITNNPGVREMKTGVKLVEDDSETMTASSSSGMIVEEDCGSDSATAVKCGRFLKQVGKVVGKEKQADGSVYIYVEFEGVKGVRIYKNPLNPHMYYVIDKFVDSCGKTATL